MANQWNKDEKKRERKQVGDIGVRRENHKSKLRVMIRRQQSKNEYEDKLGSMGVKCINTMI